MIICIFIVFCTISCFFMRNKEVEDTVNAGSVAARLLGGQTLVWCLQVLMRCFFGSVNIIISEQRLKNSNSRDQLHDPPNFKFDLGAVQAGIQCLS